MIYDMNLLKRFYYTVLKPIELKENELWYLHAQARKKYFRNLGAHDPITAKMLVRKNDWEYFRCKILLYEAIVKNSYYYSKDEGIIKPPKESLVMYMDVNPKDIMKSYKAILATMTEEMYQKIVNKDKVLRHPDKIALSEIHKHASRKIYTVIDIDSKEGIDISPHDILYRLLQENNIINSIQWVTKTRGGYHVIFNNKLTDMRNLCGKILTPKGPFKKELELGILDRIKGMTPLPGTMQGGKEVKSLSKKDLFLFIHQNENFK